MSLPAPLTYTVAEAAALVGVSESSYYALLLKGEVPGRKVGKRWVVPKPHLEQFLLGDEDSWSPSSRVSASS